VNARRIAHIVDNFEVDVTECGLLLKDSPRKTKGEWDLGPYSVINYASASRHIARWDDDARLPETPESPCQACWQAYTA